MADEQVQPGHGKPVVIEDKDAAEKLTNAAKYAARSKKGSTPIDGQAALAHDQAGFSVRV
jgi:hypothetical protein